MKRHLEYPEIEDFEPKMRKEFFRIRRLIETTEPNLEKILQTPLLKEDKADLFQLYEVFEMAEDASPEKLEIRKRFETRWNQALLRKEKHDKKFEERIEVLSKHNESEELQYDILKLETSLENQKVIFSEYKRMISLPHYDEERPKIRNWLSWALRLPHDKIKNISGERTLEKAKERMDRELYGMGKAKEQILLFLASRMANPKLRCSLGLIGAPGCGKTSLVRLLADILEYPLEQISLGGLQSSEYLKGHQYTYIGSEPGEIVKCLCRMGCKNGILFFDEYDKISDNKDVCSALLHITDTSQNSKFNDTFLSGISIDLSHLWFAYSMNTKPTDLALADRIAYVEVSGYSKEDKKNIVRDYLLRKVEEELFWEKNSLRMDDESVDFLVSEVSAEEPGIRGLVNATKEIGNKINFLLSKHKFKTSFELERKISLPILLRKEDLKVLLRKGD